jgi:type III secretion protein W
MSSETPISGKPFQPEVAQTPSRLTQVSNAQVQQFATPDDMQDWAEEVDFNPLAIARKFESIEKKKERGGKDDEKDAEKAKKEEKILQVEKINAIADEYSRKSHQELQARTLVFVRERITKDDTPEEVIRKVLDTYPDYSLADDVLDFLIETSTSEIASIVKLAKDQLNRDFGREIIAGKNIGDRAREFALQGLGSPTALRDIYRDITGNPREANTLFEQLSTAFPYEKMKTVIDFMLHSLGADLKSKGPSIARAELHRLMTETRVLQAILGVYRFFRVRMRLISGSFKRRGLLLPSRITFEVLAKLFMKYLQERYPSPDKVLQLAIPLGISEELIAQLIIFTQLRDATRQIAPRLFRDDKHKQDTLRSFLEALKQIEEEEEEEKEGEEKGRKKKKKEQPEEKA